MAINTETLAAAMGYTNNSIAGGGVIKGKNCVITSIDELPDRARVTFQWTLDNGTVQSDIMDVLFGENGQSIDSVDVNAQNHLIVTYMDGTTHDAGALPINDPEVITYTQWQQLTPQQQESGSYIVQNYPVSSGYVLTQQDKQDIANIVLAELSAAQTGSE